MSKQWAGGSSPAWRRTRRAVLERDAHRCRIRIAGVCTTIATQAHHTVGRAVTGDDPAHIVAACAPCNAAVGDPATSADPEPTPSRWWE